MTEAEYFVFHCHLNSVNLMSLSRSMQFGRQGKRDRRFIPQYTSHGAFPSAGYFEIVIE